MEEWLANNGDRKIIELHFQSILGQSRAAIKCFYSWLELTGNAEEYGIYYAPDPCNPMAQLGRERLPLNVATNRMMSRSYPDTM